MKLNPSSHFAVSRVSAMLRLRRPPAVRSVAPGAVLVTAVFVAAVLIAAGSSATPASSAASLDPGAEKRIAAALQDGIAASSVPGLSVTVVDGGGVYEQGFGDAGGSRTVTPATPFVIGSTSKSFTALAVMQLVDAGKVALDAPVREYVPEFELKDRAEADRITVRHVLQQTSGLPEIASGPNQLCIEGCPSGAASV